MIRIKRIYRHYSKLSISIRLLSRNYYIKINFCVKESIQEKHGYNKLKLHYVLPKKIAFINLRVLAICIYEYWGNDNNNQGLLFDILGHKDKENTVDFMTSMKKNLFQPYINTYKLVTQDKVIQKLFKDRAKTNGRLYDYYGEIKKLKILNVKKQKFILNNVEYELKFTQTINYLNDYFTKQKMVHSIISQGDPTDLNIGNPFTFFDYDTSGRNSLFGEFAVFVIYLAYFGDYLVPKYNPSVFKYHSNALKMLKINAPTISYNLEIDKTIVLNVKDSLSKNRKFMLQWYCEEIIIPICKILRIKNFEKEMQPYLLMRLLAVYNIFELEEKDTMFLLSKILIFTQQNFKLEDLYK